MTNPSAAFRAFIVYALVLPLALVLGLSLASTDLSRDPMTWGIVGLVLLLLCSPLLLRWYHPLLFLSWGAGVTVFFLPGSPQLWLVVAFMSLPIAMFQRAIQGKTQFISAPSLLWPVIFLTAVVLITAQLTGGFGLRVLGSGTYGAKRYIWILGAVAGFLAMLTRQIPLQHAKFYIGLFFLGSLMNVVGSLIPYGPTDLYWLAYIFPVQTNDLTGMSTEDVGNTVIRFFGMTVACQGLFFYLLARYGIRSLLEEKKLWQLALLTGVGVLGAYGGYRSYLVLVGLTFLAAFYFEKLFRSKYGFILIASLLLGFGLLFPFATKLPLSVQRTISFLPVDIDPIARFDAECSTEWRLNIWRAVWPDVPRYLWLGKGLGIAGQELEVTRELNLRRMVSSEEVSKLAGDYHSGPLSTIIPFGVWGALAWLWFVLASLRALHLNYRYGDQELKRTNGFLLAYFVAQTIFFLSIFGNFSTDMATFLGIVGLSLSLNGGIRRSVTTPEPELQSFSPRIQSRMVAQAAR